MKKRDKRKEDKKKKMDTEIKPGAEEVKQEDKKIPEAEKPAPKPKPKPKPKTIEEKYQDALIEIDELKKKRMYLQADMENSRKIGLKRMENSKFSIKVNVISNFLPIVDSFEAAISKYESTSKQDYQQLLDGVKSLQKQFLQVLSSLGIKPIEQINVPFNYKEHDVFMKMVNEEQPEDTVIKIAQKGYYLGENVLRPAKVIVSKKRDKPNDAIPVDAEVVDVKEIALAQNQDPLESKPSEEQEKPKPEENTKTDYIS